MTARPSRKDQYGVYRDPAEIHKEPLPAEVRMAAAPQLIAHIGRIELWRKGDELTITEVDTSRTHTHDPLYVTMTLTQWRHLVREAGTQ